MPDRSGLDCLAALRERMPEVKVIILSEVDDQSSIDGALAMGAGCFVGKAVDPRDLAATVWIMATKAPIYPAGGSRAGSGSSVRC